MSYSILYRPMFVKLSDNTYITTAEMGDNNVYECTSPRRRSRSWGVLRWLNEGDKDQPQKLSYSEQNIMQNVRTKMDEIARRWVNRENYQGGYYTFAEIYKHMGYFSSTSIAGKGTGNSSAQMHINFSAKGIRNAVTFDQMEQHGVYLQFGWYEKKEGSEWPDYMHDTAVNEQEAREKFARLTSEGKDVYISLMGWGIDRLYSEVTKSQKVERKKVEHVEGYAVRYSYQGCTYLQPKGTRHFLRFYHTLNDHTVYPTEAAARKAMAKLANYSGISDQHIVKVTRPDAQSKWELAA